MSGKKRINNKIKLPLVLVYYIKIKIFYSNPLFIKDYCYLRFNIFTKRKRLDLVLKAKYGLD